MASHKTPHMYQRAVIGASGYVIYRCALPDCSHYLPEPLVVGKRSLCNRCKEKTCVIKRERSGSILHKPHCKACTAEPRNPAYRKRVKLEGPKKQIPIDAIDSILGIKEPD